VRIGVDNKRDAVEALRAVRSWLSDPTTVVPGAWRASAREALGEAYHAVQQVTENLTVSRVRAVSSESVDRRPLVVQQPLWDRLTVWLEQQGLRLSTALDDDMATLMVAPELWDQVVAWLADEHFTVAAMPGDSRGAWVVVPDAERNSWAPHEPPAG
jgi:hypothetical protein